MGPQIIVYNKLKRLQDSEVALCEDGSPEESNVATFFSNPDFPAHITGLDSTIYYKCTGKMLSFSGGTYEEYGAFKDHLAQIAGFKNAKDVWHKNTMGYFVELINFSDYEGTIGPILCSKLYKDFKDMYQRAEHYFAQIPNSNKFWNCYKNWLKALKYAQQDGAILFI